MKINKQVRRDAKELFQACKVNGVLDDNKVRQVVQQLVEKKPRGYIEILSYLQRLVKLDLDRRSAVVESANGLAPELQNAIRENLSRRYGQGLNFTFKENPQLLGGVRVRVGSDVYDGSIQARLTALEESF